MAFLTDRKRAGGQGSARAGTAHHIFMQLSGAGRALGLPVFVFVFGRALGGTHEAVLATFANPFVAILSALVLVATMAHFRKGAQMMFEDYARGGARHALIAATTILSHVITATGLFALARIAL